MRHKNRLRGVHNYFLEVIGSQLEKMEGKHVYLEGIKNMVESKIYVRGIFEDVLIIKNVVNGKRLLDFGTGSGYIALLLAELGYNVEGIDISNFKEEGDQGTHDTMAYDQSKIWHIFEKKYPNLKLSHYKKEIPFPDKTFDCVVAYAVLEHIPFSELEYVMKEIRRVLKPGGHLSISRLPRKLAYTEFIAEIAKIPHHDKLYSYLEIKGLLNKHGFKIISKSITDIFPAYPSKLTNPIFPILAILERVLIHTPLKYFAHDMRILSKKLSK